MMNWRITNTLFFRFHSERKEERAKYIHFLISADILLKEITRKKRIIQGKGDNRGGIPPVPSRVGSPPGSGWCQDRPSWQPLPRTLLRLPRIRN